LRNEGTRNSPTFNHTHTLLLSVCFYFADTQMSNFVVHNRNGQTHHSGYAAVAPGTGHAGSNGVMWGVPVRAPSAPALTRVAPSSAFSAAASALPSSAPPRSTSDHRWRPWSLSTLSTAAGAQAARAAGARSGATLSTSPLSGGDRAAADQSDVVTVGRVVLEDSRRFFVTKPNVSVPAFAAEAEANAINVAMVRAESSNNSSSSKRAYDSECAAAAAAAKQSGIRHTDK
jgi:hypothetical protein